MACTPKPVRRLLKAAAAAKRRGLWAMVYRENGRVRLHLWRVTYQIINPSTPKEAT